MASSRERAAQLVRPISFFLTLLALGAAAKVLAPRIFREASGPQADVLVSLKQRESEGIRISLGVAGEGELISRRVMIDRVTVELGREGADAQAVFTLDYDGQRGATQVSSLGLERVRLVRTGSGWAPVNQDWTPTLSAAVRALAARERALDQGDLSALASLVSHDPRASAWDDAALKRLLAMTDRRYQSLAWYLRAERAGVLVTEEYRLSGVLPDRPVDEKGTRRLSLVLRGQELRFQDALM
jgi:hypothetical protein